MAYGSATVRTKTTVKTQTKSTTRVHNPVASTSKAPPMPLVGGRKLQSSSQSSQEPAKPRLSGVPDPPSEDDDDDPDFGTEAKAAVKEEVDALMEKEDEKKYQAKVKKDRAAAKARGETYKAPKRVKKETVESTDDEAERKLLKRRKEKGKGREEKEKVENSQDSEDGKKKRDKEKEPTLPPPLLPLEPDPSLNPTRPTYKASRKRIEVERRLNYSIGGGGRGSGDSSDSDDELDPSRDGEGENALSPEEETKKKLHLARRWVNRHEPEKMNLTQKKLEERYNPLIKLLDIDIVVAFDSKNARKNDSDDETAEQQVLETDSENSDSSARKKKTKKKKTSASSFGGQGNTLGSAPSARRTSPGSRTKVKREVFEDVKPSTSRFKEPDFDDDDEMEDIKPDIKPTVTRDVEMGSVSCAESDTGPEPDTEDDEDVIVVEQPAAPALAPAPQPSDKGKEKAIEILDSDEEPETESDSEPIARGPLVAQVLGELPIEMDIDSAVDSDAEPSTEADEPFEAGAPEEEEDDEEEDAMTRALRTAVAKNAAAQKQVDAATLQRETEARIMNSQSQRLSELQSSSPLEHEDAEDEGEETDDGFFKASQRASQSQTQTVYPFKSKQGRPKFLIHDRQQAMTGAHILSEMHHIPPSINRFLRQYQREGVEFLYRQYRRGIGGILGDDMGLGKTIQVIAFLSAVMRKTGLRKDEAFRDAQVAQYPDASPSQIAPTALVICPASVVHNWEREFATWSYIKTIIYSGSQKERLEALTRYARGYIDVVISSFEAASKNIGILAQRDFSIIIVDEAHRVKNPRAQITINLNLFPTTLRYGLTGTAIQNRLSEFHCILNWSVPGKVGNPKQWSDLVDRPLKYTQKADATDDQLVKGRKRALALVTRLLPKFWLRRTKHDPTVKLQLPRKTDNVILCPLTKLQKTVYENLLQLDEVQIILTAFDPCDCGATDSDGKYYQKGKCCHQNWSKLIFKYMTLFAKVANHLALIYPDKTDIVSNPDKYDQDLQWASQAFPDDYQNRKRGPGDALDQSLCGKWKILSEMLALWKDNGDKVLIFSMSLTVLDLLKDLFEYDAKYEYRALDGSVPNDQRMGLVDEFNDPNGDIFCFLLSTRAGGVGLNLTAANRVVVFDPAWNPSHDLQAMDRSYRFGQTRDVHVYRLIGAGTLEELIINRQHAKRALANLSYEANHERRLFHGIEGEGRENHGELYGVANIFKFSPNISLTEKSIKTCEVAEADFSASLDSVGDDENLDRDEVLPEPDLESDIKELLGMDALDLTEEQIEALRKKQAERHEITKILSGGGAKTIDSDKNLGSSKSEEARTRRAMQGMSGQGSSSKKSSGSSHKSASALPVATSSRSKAIAPPSKKRPLPDITEEWDPLKRGKKDKKDAPAGDRASSSSSSSASKPRSPPSDNTFEWFRKQHDISRKVSNADIFHASGYKGAAGTMRLMEEIRDTTVSDASKIEKLNAICRRYVEEG